MHNLFLPLSTEKLELCNYIHYQLLRVKELNFSSFNVNLVEALSALLRGILHKTFKNDIWYLRYKYVQK